ncbi:MAG TPA: hypothetical protein VFA48_00590 [Gammaproteobacteria bacterium]|nr:hypothetical protein [Gammaproteobacteria bacterium]
MNSKAADRNVLDADNPGQTGPAAVKGHALVAKRKYAPPRCHRLMCEQTEGKTFFSTSETLGSFGPS